MKETDPTGPISITDRVTCRVLRYDSYNDIIVAETELKAVIAPHVDDSTPAGFEDHIVATRVRIEKLKGLARAVFDGGKVEGVIDIDASR